MRFIKPVFYVGLCLNLGFNASQATNTPEDQTHYKEIVCQENEYVDVQNDSPSERIYTIWDDQPAPNRGGGF